MTTQIYSLYIRTYVLYHILPNEFIESLQHSFIQAETAVMGGLAEKFPFCQEKVGSDDGVFLFHPRPSLARSAYPDNFNIWHLLLSGRVVEHCGIFFFNKFAPPLSKSSEDWMNSFHINIFCLSTDSKFGDDWDMRTRRKLGKCFHLSFLNPIPMSNYKVSLSKKAFLHRPVCLSIITSAPLHTYTLVLM